MVKNLRKDQNSFPIREIGNQCYIRGPTKIHPEQNLTTNYNRQRIQSGSEHEIATSDCSETDSVWQSNIPKINNARLVSKPKRQQQLRTVKSTEFR